MIQTASLDRVRSKVLCFETMLFNVINGALKKAREATQQEMAKMMHAGGAMSGLFGK